MRHLTEPEVSKAFYPRISTGVNLRAVLRTLAGCGGDETTMGLALQVIDNVMREWDGTTGQPPPQQDGGRGRTDPSLTKSRAGTTGPRHTKRAQSLLHGLETETHIIEQAIRSLYNKSSQNHIAQIMGIETLQALTPEDYSHSERRPEDRALH